MNDSDFGFPESSRATGFGSSRGGLRGWQGALLAALMLSLPGLAEAGRWSTLVGAEGWNDEHTPAHGVLLVGWDGEARASGLTPFVEYNTDTVRAGYYGLRLGGQWSTGLMGTVEYGVAGLLPDYYQRGATVPERGFLAGFLALEAQVKGPLADRLWFEAVIGGRRWLFDTLSDTSKDLTLPPETFVAEGRLRLTYWRLQDDPAWRDRFRLHPRLRGFAIGVELGADYRTDDTAWGALASGAFAVPDGRNAPESLIFRPRQWLKAGWQANAWLRLQFEQQAAFFGHGEDDLTRDRLGGMTPYVAPLPGAPWASWLSERYVSGLFSAPLRLGGGLELGPTASFIWLEDIDRLGEDEMDTLWGVGAVLDWRFGDWQVDLRGGYSGAVADLTDEVAWSAWLAVGRGW